MAEKIETIFSKLETSSRMKDYYDIYLIYKYGFELLNRDDFRRAVEKTFFKRGFGENLNKCLEIVKNSERLHTYWRSYARKNKFVENVSFDDTIRCLEKFIKLLTPVVS